MVWAGMPSSATAARINSSSTGVCGRSVSSIETSITGDWPPLACCDAAIDAARLADRRQELPRRLGDHRPGDFQRPVHAGQSTADRQDARAGRRNRSTASGPASTPIQSATSSVKKSLASRKASTVFRPMWSASTKYGPVQPRARTARVGLGPNVGRAAAHDRVLAVRLVPDGSDVDALAAGQDQRIELGRPLMGETVANAHRIRGNCMKEDSSICRAIFYVAPRRFATAR